MKPLVHSAPDKSASSSAPLLLGYSGGGDSTALLLDLIASGRPVIAAIVDHGLREGSAADSARAAAIAREAGATAEVLTLRWPDGPKRAQASARRARMSGLAALARRVGVASIALAHTRDDQAETVLIRLSAGSSWFGLAGMSADSPVPLWPEGRALTLHRPLLRERRAVLRARLIAANASWIEDPANARTDYARVRARARLTEWETSELGVERWAALADRLTPHAQALDEAARAAIGACATFEASTVRLGIEQFRALPPDVQRRALGALIAAAGGAERAPEEAALDRLLAAPEKGRTLGGAKLSVRRGGWEISRDPGGVVGRGPIAPIAPLTLPLGETVIWDGRLALTAAEPGWTALPSADGQAPQLQRGKISATIANAKEIGAVAAEWLIRERIAHLLWR